MCLCRVCVSAAHVCKQRTSSALANADAPSAPISLLLTSSLVSAGFVCATREAASQRDRAAGAGEADDMKRRLDAEQGSEAQQAR